MYCMLTNFVRRNLSSETPFDCPTSCKTAEQRKHRLTEQHHISYSETIFTQHMSAKWIATMFRVQGVPGSKLELETGCRAVPTSEESVALKGFFQIRSSTLFTNFLNFRRPRPQDRLPETTNK